MLTIPAHAKEILLITTSHVGNNLFCTPAIRLLKKQRPDLQLDMLALSKPGAEVFHDNSDLRKIYIKKNWRWRVRRFAEKYDFIIIFNKSVANHYFPNPPQHVATPGTFQAIHRADQMIEFIQNLLGSFEPDHDKTYLISTKLTHYLQIQDLLPSHENQILIGMHLGCGRTAEHGWKFWYKKRDKAQKLWPLTRYIELAKILKKLNPAIRIVITGSKNERFLAKGFLQAIPDSIDLVSKTSIQSLAALMKYLKLFVTHDTGALHVACTRALPIVCVFGRTHPEVTGPYPLQPYHTIIKKDQVVDITAEEVAKAVMGAL